MALEASLRQAYRTLARLATLRLPVLLVMGDADLLSPPALMRMLAAPIPQCRLARVPEAGHAGFWEQPGRWNRLVLAFLQQHRDDFSPRT